MNYDDMGQVFEIAAKSALFSWKQSTEGVDDLINDLWVWYLETPSTQKKMSGLVANEAIKTARIRALQLLSKSQLTANTFRGMDLYSADSVRCALRGQSTNLYLMDILPLAIDALAKQNYGHAEAIRSRYIDGTVPSKVDGEAMLLSRAVKSLTEHVNVIAITAGAIKNPDGTIGPSNKTPGVGRHSEVFPENRRQRGGDHSDPTGNTAIMLIEHGDEEHVLCALVNRQPVHSGKARSNYLDSDQTTTLRKEYLG